MSSKTNNKMVYGSILLGTCVIFCIAIAVEAQYNTFDSDSNSDSDGSPILTKAELGKLVRNSAKMQAQQNNLHRNQQQHAAATRNLYNRQQPLQFDQSQPRQQRNFGSFDNLNGFGPVMGSASNGRGSNSEVNDDEDGGSSLGPNFGANFDSADNDGDGEGNNANSDGVSNLNQAASGYPAQGDYNNDGLGFGFGNGDSFTSANAEFAPNFGNEGRRSKSASSPLGSRGFGVEDDAGAPQFGPNSAVNSGGGDDDDRSSYVGEVSDNDNDDE